MTNPVDQTQNLFGTSANQAIFVYVDESGDTGLKDGASQSYTLGVVMVEASNWNVSLEELKRHRRALKKIFGIQLRREIKSNFLMRGSGDLSSFGLSPSQRSWIFKNYLKLLANQKSMTSFAILVHKSDYTSSSTIFETAWITLFQRLQKTSTALGNRPIILIHDAGEDERIRKIARWSRVQLSAGQMYGSSNFSVPFLTLIEDPVPRNSRDSYFLQLADIVAYTAFRRIIPGKQSANSVVKTKFWDEIGVSIFKKANQNHVVTAQGIVEIK